MAVSRPCTAKPCPHRAAPQRLGWTLALLLLLVTPFAGFVMPARVLAHHTNIKLPFASGATWRVLQGYNGSSHQNTSSTYQYLYSLDLVRVAGNTAGQRVISPVDGTIRWIDTTYGGMSINLGDGYAFAYFHTYPAPGLAAGQTVSQGQYLGTIAAAGDAGNGGTPHIHVTLWTTNDGGNWDRHAEPFTGDHKLDGYDFPDKGGTNQYAGTQVVSSNVEIAASGTGSPPNVPTLVSPPTGTTYTTSPTSVTLSWNAVSGATAYQVVINDGSITSPWIGTTSWSTGSLGNGQYSWQVRAKNDSGTSNLSAKWVFWVDPGSAPTPTPTSTPGGSPSLAMSLDTTSGRVGTTVNAGGTGYGANETVRLYLDAVSGANQIGQATTNGSGAWSTSVTIPDAVGGGHPIIGRGATSGKQVTQTFTVTSYLNRTPYTGPPGTTINLTVQGFGANETVRVTFDTTTGPLLANVATNARGTGSTTFPLPAASNGWHDYVGVGQTSGLVAWGALYIERLLTASPAGGAPGTPINASAQGFPANANITLAWNQVNGSGGTQVCAGATDGNGSYSCSFPIPQVGAGSYPLVATANGRTASTTIGVTGPASVSVAPASAPVGANIRLTVGGFAPNETVNFSWDSSGTAWQSGTTDGNGALNFPALVPQLGLGGHTLKATGATSGKSASTPFRVVAGSPGNSSMTGPGTFAVTATQEGLVGSGTSNGHTITPYDHFVALPACTQSSCPWLSPGGSSHVAACGSNCYVRVTNPATNKCSVAPVWDVGPWFTNDNWWDPTNQRNLNNLATTKNVLPQGYVGADAARDGLDVGYGLSNGIGVSNVGYEVGNRAAIDIADGTWVDIGFADGQGIGQVVVTILWLTGEDHAAAARACGQTGTATPTATPSPTSTPTPTATATSTATPSISLSRTSGSVASSITVTGSAFGSGETVDIFLDSTQSTAIAGTTAAGDGSFSVAFKVPDATGGSHKVYARGRTSGASANQPFRVTPSLIRNPSSGSNGTKISVSAKGFGANESVQLRWDSSSGPVLATLTSGASGSARGSFRIPTGSSNGNHTIYGGGLTSGLRASKTVAVSNPTTASVSVSLSPSSGSPRSTVTASGANFSANETVDLFWDTSTTSGGSGAADGAGNVAITVAVPLMPAGNHTVAVKGRTSGKSATATYAVVPSLELAPASGAGRSSVTVKGRGWSANTSVSVYWNRTATKSGTLVCTVTASSTGTFSCTLTVPNVSAGTYPIVGVQGSATATANFQVTAAAAAGLSVGEGSPTAPADATSTESASATPPATTTASPTGTASATETGTPTPTATATAASTPAGTGMLALSPNRGPVGTTVTVTGSGFGSGEQVDVYFRATDTAPLATLAADTTGSFTGSVVIPDASAGNYRIVAKGQTTGVTATKTFRLTRPRADRSGSAQGAPTATGAPNAANVQPAGATATGVPTVGQTPTPEPSTSPTSQPAPQNLVFLPVANTSVAPPNPDGTPTAQGAGRLAAGGTDGSVAFVTFQVQGIAQGSTVRAKLVLTNVGAAGAAAGTLGALPGVAVDEQGWTYETAPVSGVPPAVAADGSAAHADWLDPGVPTAIDVSGSVGADGTITFVIFGTPDAKLVLGDRESAAPPRLVVTVLSPS